MSAHSQAIAEKFKGMTLGTYAKVFIVVNAERIVDSLSKKFFPPSKNI